MLNHSYITFVFVVVLSALAGYDFFAELNPLYYVLIIGVYLATEFYGAAYIQSNFHIPAICQIQTTDKVIALTFDDGPCEGTLKILDELKKADVRATFFCIGKNIQGNEKILRRIADEGHIIGNHSYSHDYWYDLKNKSSFKYDLQLAETEIKKITGKKTRYFRPPYGVTTPALAKATKTLQYHVIGWNIRSLDTKLKDPDKILTRIKRKIRPGSIILMHDSVNGTGLAIAELLSHLKQNNYRIVPLDQLVNQAPYA